MNEFADNTVDAVQEPVVEVRSELANTVDAVQESVVGAKIGEDARPAQSIEENRAFAAMRRDKETLQASQQNMLKAMQQLGFTGDNLDDIATQIVAFRQGMTVEEYQRQEQQQAEQQQAMLHSNPYVQELEQELHQYRQQQAQKVFDSDLATIKSLDPHIKSLDELGDTFIKLRMEGVDTEVAYNAIRAATKKQTVPQSGAVGETPIGGTSLGLDNISDDEMELLIAKAKRGEMKGF